MNSAALLQWSWDEPKNHEPGGTVLKASKTRAMISPWFDQAPVTVGFLPNDLCRKNVIYPRACCLLFQAQRLALFKVMLPQQRLLAFEDCGPFGEDFRMRMQPAYKGDSIRCSLP